jgi:hypothetical protein
MSLSAAAALSARKDVVVGVLGATAALAGLVLVFLGVLVTAYQTLLGSSVRTATLERFRRAAFVALVVFLTGLASVTVSTSWLVLGAGRSFYGAVLVLFFLELAALAVVAVYATVWVLLR